MQNNNNLYSGGGGQDVPPKAPYKRPRIEEKDMGPTPKQMKDWAELRNQGYYYTSYQGFRNCPCTPDCTPENATWGLNIFHNHHELESFLWKKRKAERAEVRRIAEKASRSMPSMPSMPQSPLPLVPDSPPPEQLHYAQDSGPSFRAFNLLARTCDALASVSYSALHKMVDKAVEVKERELQSLEAADGGGFADDRRSFSSESYIRSEADAILAGPRRYMDNRPYRPQP